jgi:ABC-type sugar transport system ATPase subunit
MVLGEQVRALADHGHAVLLVEQRAQAALRLADSAYVLVQGQVAMAAPAADVLASPEMAEVFLGGQPASGDNKAGDNKAGDNKAGDSKAGDSKAADSKAMAEES